MTDTSQKAKTQCNRLLRHLRTHKRGITDLDAYNLYQIRRTAARIWDLRHKGYNIRTEYESYVNEDGHNVRYGRYILED